EVIGSDESFFEGELPARSLRELYTERAGILDDDKMSEVDLSSQAFQIWKDAAEADRKAVEALPDVVYSAKSRKEFKPGVLVFARTSEDNDALAWINSDGDTVTENQFEILTAAACPADEPAIERSEGHHALVQTALDRISEETRKTGGHLGSRRST